MLIYPPVWYPDGSPPTQPKGLNPLEGFIGGDHSALYGTLINPCYPCSPVPPPVPLIYKPKGWFLPC